MKLNRKWVVPFIFLLVIFSNTCKNNVGLGGHIDITPPTCQLTFPTESLPIIRNSFTLKGVASDDNVVDKVKVVLKSVDRAWEGALELPCVVEKSGNSWAWSVVVNKPNTDGSFPLKDGKYNVRILAYDKDGKEGESTSVLIIDNTPPVLFIQRPSSFATIDKIDERSDNYGADLILKGSAADDSGLSSLVLFSYGNDRWEKQVIPSVSTSINVKVDGFFSSTPTEKGIYRKLYGDDSNKGLKIFPCAIKVFDNAKEYESPNSTGDAEKGNVSNDYYLHDVLYNIEDEKDPNKQLIFPKYKIQDIYDMLKGSFYLNDKGIEDAEKKSETNKIIEALKTGKFGNSTKRFRISCPIDTEVALTNENRALMGLLGLNPFKSPTFEVLSFKPCKIDFNATSHNDVYKNYTRTKGGTLTIKISPNLDESPLKDFDEFEFYYCKLTDYVQYFKDNGNKILDPHNPSGAENIMQKIKGVVSKKVGSSYMVTLPVEGDADKGDLNIGSSYVILVKGKDKDENPVVIDPSNIESADGQVTYVYGVKIIGSGSPSDVRVTKIANYGDEEHEISERVYVKSGKDVTFKFTANSENTPFKVSYTLKFGDTKKAEAEKTNLNTSTVKDEFTIDKSSFERNGIHSLYVEIEDASAQTTTKKYSIYCDDVAPVLDIKSLEERSKTCPKIEGRLYDAGCGVEISALNVEYVRDGEPRQHIAVQEGENKANGEWKLEDMSDISRFPEGLYVFYFNVEDKLGNAIPTDSKTVKVHFDKTPPNLTITTIFPEWINTRTYNVNGTASDGTGVGIKAIKCKVNGDIQTLSKSNDWNGVLEFKKDGEYTLAFFAEDEVGNKSSEETRMLKVDTVLPTLTLVTPESGDILLANNASVGKVEISANDPSSASNPASGVKEVRYSTDKNATFETAIPMHEASGKYKATITDTPTANTVYYFWAKDNAGNVSEALELKVKIDTTLPNIELKTLSPEVAILESGTTKKYTNKIATVTGVVSDNLGIKDIKITDENGQALKGFEKKNWDFEGNKTAFFSFSFDTEQYANPSTLKVKAIAEDIAGNKKESDLFEINIKQETDIPIVTVFSFEKINETPLIRSPQLTGNVTDDDGIKAMYIQIGGGGYEPIEKKGQSIGSWTWAYNLPSGVEEGVLSLKFKVQDAEDNEFEVDATDVLKRVRVKGNVDNDLFKDSNIKFNYDSTPPTFMDEGVRFSFTSTFPAPSGSITKYGKVGNVLGTNVVLGNKTNKIISIRALAKDKLGLKSATLVLGGVTETLPNGATQLSTINEDGFDVIDFNNVDISRVEEGSLPLKIEIIDNSGFSQIWQTTCIIDFKEPVVELISPIDAVYFGKVSLMGKITDEPTISGKSVSGVDVESISYSIGGVSNFVKEHKDEGILLSNLESSSASWTINIPSIEKYADKTEYGAIKHTSGDSEFWTIPVKIKGKDKAGNEVTSREYSIKFDPAGDTPYIEILSPDDGSTLGGTAVLSGTARVANPNSGKHVNEIYLQLSETEVFNDTPWEIGGKDYGKAGGEKLNLSSNITYWLHTFEASALLKSGETSKPVYFRLRGKSGAGSATTKTGEWTNVRKFIISTNVAKFEEVKLVGASYNENYVANAKWIKGDNYVITGRVTHDQGISKIDAKTGLVGSGIKALDESDKSNWFTKVGNNYSFSIPIKTAQYTPKYGYIEFDIKATDARTSDASEVSQKILLKYDNSAPSCAVGDSAFGNNVVGNASFFSGKFTSYEELKGDKSSYRVLVNGTRYKIAEIASDKKKITLENATGLNGDFYYAIVKEPKILQGNPCTIRGVAEDLGSGIKEVRVKLEVNNKTEEVVINSYVSSHNKLVKQAGNMVSFEGVLNTENLDNGEGKLTIIAIDEAGNEVTQVVEGVRVKNKPIKITNLVFATDLSGNNAYDDNETYDCEKQSPKDVAKWRFNSDGDYRGKIDVSNVFTYKNATKSELRIKYIGGYGNVTASLYRVKYDETDSFDTKDFDEFTYGVAIATETKLGSDTEQTLVLNLNNILSELDDQYGKFILKITDQSIGNLWYAGMKIATKVEIGDGVNPAGAIFPFFYNSDEDKLANTEEQKLSSVKYEGNEAKGHIEVGKFETNEPSSVSGKVILRGFCYDNAKIKTIKLTLPKDSKTGSSRVKSTEVKTSVYNGSTGWTGDLTINVAKNHFTNTGHYVEWEYEWDSNTTLCANDVEIKLEVIDAKGSSSGTTLRRPTIKEGERVVNDRVMKLVAGDVANKHDVLALTDKDEKVYFVSVSELKDEGVSWENVNVPRNITNYALYNGTVNVPTMKINVVPYISKVTTALSSYSKATPSLYDRTALGHYSCRDNEKIKIEGFNLNNAKFYLQGIDLGGNSASLDLASGTVSGALEARVEYNDGGSKVIKSLNNTDDNKKAYNKCSNKINNDLLTNDVFVDLWGFKVGANPTDGFVSYPVLKISPLNGRVGLAFANGVANFNMAGASKNDSTWRSSRRFDQNWAQYVFTDFVFDDYGYGYGMATGVDMNKGEGVASYSKFLARTAGDIKQTNNYENDNSIGGWSLRLENIGTKKSPYTADPDRIQSPSIATVTVGSNETRVYLAYYDAINQHIRYRYGSVLGSTTSNEQLKDLTGRGQMQEPPVSSYSILAGPKTKLNVAAGHQGSIGEEKAGKYVSIGAIKNGKANGQDVVVALWYNFKARSLMYAYSDDPRKDNVEWKGEHVVDVGGEYVKCAIDRDKGIHVAYYSSGDLKYAYLPSYNSSDWKIATVDSYSLAGTHISIDLAKDPSTMKWVPYIGYYMPGNANARLAYLVGGIDSDVPDGAIDEKYTGKWEISIIPTKNVIKEYRISVGVWADMSTGVLKAIPSVTDNVQGYGGNGESLVGGNGTSNPILGYAVEEGGAFELAQKK